MTTTTFKNVRGGTTQPAAQPAPTPKKPRAKVAKPIEEKKPEPTVEEPKRGPLMIVIDGAGTMPLIDNNGRRVMRGEPVEVSEDEIAWLTSTRSGFKRV